MELLVLTYAHQAKFMLQEFPCARKRAVVNNSSSQLEENFIGIEMRVEDLITDPFF